MIRIADKQNKYQNPSGSEAGITLLMSVLIVSTLFLISMAVTALAIQEIRATRSTRLTEPAIIAAESAGEQGLFYFKQTNAIPTVCSSNGNTAQITGSCSNASLRVSKTLTYDEAVIQLQPGEERRIYLYDPNAKDTNLLMDISGTPVFDNLYVRHLTGGSSVDVDVLTLGGTPVGNQNVNPGGVAAFDVANVSEAVDKRIEIIITGGTTTNTIEVSTDGFYSWSGVPDYPVIQAEACSSNAALFNCTPTNLEVYRRRLEITVPR